MLDLHRFLGGLAVIFVGVHLVGLMLDSYVEFSLADLFVPFVADWRPLAMAWGITAFYLLLEVEVTSLLKKRMAITTWRWIHWLSYPLFALTAVHMFQAGTDSRNPAMIITVAVGVSEVAFLLVVRLTVPKTGSLVPFGQAGAAYRPSRTSPPVAPSGPAPARALDARHPAGPPR